MTSDGHRRAWELIPWVLNGRASGEESALVEAHVRTCADCAAELQFQRQVQQGMQSATVPELDLRGGLERIWKRIDARGDDSLPSRTPALARWLAVAVVVEAIGLAALSTDVLFSARNAPYQTLTSSMPLPAHASLRVVFTPQLPQAELQALLQRNALQIVGGPSEAGVYSLATTSDPSAALASLRSDARVLFAEPVQ